MADHDTHDHTGVPGVGTVSEILDIPTAETDDTLVLAPDGAGGVEFRAEAGGGGVSEVSQNIGADYNTNGSSTWTDITGLTGISLTAGTWVGIVDLETGAGATFAPVYRVSDGTNIYAQGGHLYNYPGVVVSNHFHMSTKPFVLVGSATMKVQYYTDTAHNIYRYPVRGGSSAVDATHVTFLKIA